MLPQAKDILWKGIIEDLFADFLRFFYTDADDLFDMDRGFEFLDKELGQLYPDQDMKHPKYVDKLVKVYRKDGTEEWLLIHIEVQGYNDKQFARRMFTYFYRILDRFDKEVASIAVFSDNDEGYCPDRYEYNSLETSNVFRFKTYKIKGQNKTALENSDNPFAIVVLTVLIALQASGKDSVDLLSLSMDLVKRLFRKGFSKKKINSLLTFIKSYVYLHDKDIFLKFEKGIDIITNKERTMGTEEMFKQLIKEDTQSDIIANLLRKTNLSTEEIADVVNVSTSFVIEVKEYLDSIEKAN